MRSTTAGSSSSRPWAMPTSSSGGGLLLILAPSPSRRLPHPPPRAAPRASHLDTTTRARRAHPASPSSPAWLRWTPATHLRLLPRPWRGLCSGRTHTTRRSPSRCTPTATSSLDRDPGDPSSSPVVRIGSLSSSSPADRISKEIEERRSKMPGVLYYGRVPPSEPREPDSPSSPETQFVGDEYSPSSLPLLDQSANMLDTVMRISSLQLDENNPTLPLLHPDHEMWSDCEDYAPDSPERHSSDDEMVQNRRLYDYEGRLQRQSDDYANLALEHYNNNEKNKLKEN